MRCPLPLILLLVLAAGGASSALCAEGPAPAAADVFTARIAPILESQCLRCHGEARQKGHLKLNSRDAMLAGGSSGPAIIVGDPEHSLLITAVRYQDRDLQMPPDDRLTEEQVADLVRWIAAGAPWAQPGSSPSATAAATATPSGSSTAAAIAPPPTDPTTATAVVDPTVATQPPGIGAGERRPPLVGRVHPLVIHFPIACLLLAVLAEFLRLVLGAAWEPAVRLLIICGTAGAIVAVVTGTWFADQGSVFQRADVTLSRHEILGWFTLTGSLICSGLLVASSAHPRLRWAFRAALLLSAGLAGLTGHFGGEMIYGEHWLF